MTTHPTCRAADADMVEIVARALHEASDSPLGWEHADQPYWRDQARAAIAAYEAESAWQPIETAPESSGVETRQVLAYGRQTGVCMGTLHRWPGRPATVSIAHLGGDAVADWGVTRWMPLPAPPAEHQLLPCPFCGAPADGPYEMNEEGLEAWREILCSDEDQCFAVMSGPSEAEAIAAWNRRAPAKHQEGTSP